MVRMRHADDDLPQRLTANHIRTARFPVATEGYDPEAVHAYLGQVADEILRLHQNLAAARADAERVKHSLRQRQSGYVTVSRRPVPQPTHSPDWPINHA